MNVIDRDTARAIPPALDEAQRAVVPPAERQQSRRLKPLLSLLPYVARYRWQAIAALMALVIAAVTTLLVPIAVGRMIDFGFSREGANLIDSYFAVMIVIVAVLAMASASRFFSFTTLVVRSVADPTQ